MHRHSGNIHELSFLKFVAKLQVLTVTSRICCSCSMCLDSTVVKTASFLGASFRFIGRGSSCSTARFGQRPVGLRSDAVAAAMAAALASALASQSCSSHMLVPCSLQGACDADLGVCFLSPFDIAEGTTQRQRRDEQNRVAKIVL